MIECEKNLLNLINQNIAMCEDYGLKKRKKLLEKLERRIYKNEQKKDKTNKKNRFKNIYKGCKKDKSHKH